VIRRDAAEPPSSLAGRVASVRERIADAARRAGRDPSDVSLVAATKDVPAELIGEAAAAGITNVGENRAQDLLAKRDSLARDARAASLRWHFFGVLQRNKIKQVVGRAVLVHSVDSPELARSVARAAQRAGLNQDVLLEVNVGGEPTKRGVPPEEVEAAARAIAGLDGLRLRGLMAVPPIVDDPQRARKWFRVLRQARDRVSPRVPGLVELSMGMSGDFELAIEEGATIVRIGTAIFGERPPSPR